MTSPKVSVIMNCHNGERHLREAVASVLAQTEPDWEIVFWDNLSADSSADVIKSYGDPRIRYFRGDTFVPLGQARNFAMKRACGRFIAFLDCDDLWMPDKLARQLPLFEEAEVALVYSDSIFFDEKGHEVRYLSNRKACRGRCFRELLRNYCVSLETVIVRASAIAGMAEWFDPRFNLVEEADFFRRIAHDWKIDFSAEPLSKWRVHSGSWTWKHADKFVAESEMMLEKYRCLFPEFGKKNSVEADILNGEILFQKAKTLWMVDKRRDAARKLLRGHVIRGKRFFALYLATFFDSGFVFEWARKLGYTMSPNR